MKTLQSSLSFDFGSKKCKHVEMAAQKQHYYKSNTSERLSWFFYFINFGINIRSVGFIRITLQKQENNSNYPTFKQNVLEKKEKPSSHSLSCPVEFPASSLIL
jgi:hypothetical protein